MAKTRYDTSTGEVLGGVDDGSEQVAGDEPSGDAEPWAKSEPRSNNAPEAWLGGAEASAARDNVATTDPWKGGVAASAAATNTSYDVWGRKPPANGTHNPANALSPDSMHPAGSRGL